MNTVRVVVLTGSVLIIIAVGVFISQRGDSTAHQAEKTELTSLQPQGQPSMIPVLRANQDIATGHQPATPSIPGTTEAVLTADLPVNTVATVNDIPITRDQLEEEFNKLMISPSTHAGIDSTRKENLRKLALDELVVRELAYQEAKKMGLNASEKEIAASYRRISKRYRTAKDFAEALNTEKLTEDDLRHRIERDLLLGKINRLVIEDRSRVRDADARQHYEANKAKFVAPASIRLWNIFLKVETGSQDQAREKADKVRKILGEGASFEAVAYKYSEDDYRVMGGDLGWVHRGQSAPDLEQVAFAGKENEIIGPFQTSSGWNIIKIGATKREHQLTYQQVKEKIKDGLYKQRLRQARIDFVNRLKAAATIKYAKADE